MHGTGENRVFVDRRDDLTPDQRQLILLQVLAKFRLEER